MLPHGLRPSGHGHAVVPVRQVDGWLDDLSDERDPPTASRERHTGRLSVPNGWRLEDRRRAASWSPPAPACWPAEPYRRAPLGVGSPPWCPSCSCARWATAQCPCPRGAGVGGRGCWAMWWPPPSSPPAVTRRLPRPGQVAGPVVAGLWIPLVAMVVGLGRKSATISWPTTACRSARWTSSASRPGAGPAGGAAARLPAAAALRPARSPTTVWRSVLVISGTTPMGPGWPCWVVVVVGRPAGGGTGLPGLLWAPHPPAGRRGGLVAAAPGLQPSTSSRWSSRPVHDRPRASHVAHRPSGHADPRSVAFNATGLALAAGR